LSFAHQEIGNWQNCLPHGPETARMTHQQQGKVIKVKMMVMPTLKHLLNLHGQFVLNAVLLFTY